MIPGPCCNIDNKWWQQKMYNFMYSSFVFFDFSIELTYSLSNTQHRLQYKSRQLQILQKIIHQLPTILQPPQNKSIISIITHTNMLTLKDFSTFLSFKQLYNNRFAIMKASLLCILALLAITMGETVTYPVRCQQIGDSVLGTVSECNVLSDPLPFRWETTIKLKKNVKWAGVDDVYYIYSNPDQTITGICQTAATLPGNFSKNDEVFISQTCNSFNPALVIGANLVVMVFYTHHDSFDDVLMYNFPIPGYINSQRQVTPLTPNERLQILTQIKEGTLKISNVKTE